MKLSVCSLFVTRSGQYNLKSMVLDVNNLESLVKPGVSVIVIYYDILLVSGCNGFDHMQIAI